MNNALDYYGKGKKTPSEKTTLKPTLSHYALSASASAVVFFSDPYRRRRKRKQQGFALFNNKLPLEVSAKSGFCANIFSESLSETTMEIFCVFLFSWECFINYVSRGD